ncbi:MAG: arabinan endo,5-alpha-L-arabinosidase [Acidobacteriaceae bacterium]|nr:arabinan endo,5-alpha-L-arabinosidase [Acidobacteriaceae bacterium]
MRLAFGLVLSIGVLSIGMAGPLAAQTAVKAPHAYTLSGDTGGTHDPSVMKQGDTWYVFATGFAPDGGQMAIRCSKDLEHWRLCGHVFDAIPQWIQEESPGTKELWAPDISYYHGEYRLYYAYSLFGKNTSGIALATNRTLDPHSPEYKWEDKGLVLRSTAADDFNAIDPNFVVDTHGGTWLALGSFWSGIKLTRLDAKTGKPAGKPRYYAIASRAKPTGAPPAKPGLPPDWEAVEAPFIVHHRGSQGNYYYLFVSWDLCCRGTKSSYRTMVGRAREITGPYVDQQGVSMEKGGGTQVLTANHRWVGPGGESLLMQPSGDIMVFHAYDARSGKPALEISTVDWSSGWPVVALGQ